MEDTVSAWLTRHMERVNTNAYGISHVLKVSPVTVYNWLNGAHSPDPDNCRKLAAFFGVPEQEVLIIAGHLSAANESLPVYTTEADHQLGDALRLFKDLSPEDRTRILRIMNAFRELQDE